MPNFRIVFLRSLQAINTPLLKGYEFIITGMLKKWAKANKFLPEGFITEFTINIHEDHSHPRHILAHLWICGHVTSLGLCHSGYSIQNVMQHCCWSCCILLVHQVICVSQHIRIQVVEMWVVNIVDGLTWLFHQFEDYRPCTGTCSVIKFLAIYTTQ